MGHQAVPSDFCSACQTPTSSHPPRTRRSGLGLREATRLPASSDIDNIGDRQQAQSSVPKYNMTLQLQGRVTDNLNYFRGKEIFILLYTNHTCSTATRTGDYSGGDVIGGNILLQ